MQGGDEVAGAWAVGERDHRQALEALELFAPGTGWKGDKAEFMAAIDKATVAFDALLKAHTELKESLRELGK